MTDRTRLEELRGRVKALDLIAREASVALAEAEGELAAAEGDESLAKFKRLYVQACRSGTHEDHEAFMECARERERAWNEPKEPQPAA